MQALPQNLRSTVDNMLSGDKLHLYLLIGTKLKGTTTIKIAETIKSFLSAIPKTAWKGSKEGIVHKIHILTLDITLALHQDGLELTIEDIDKILTIVTFLLRSTLNIDRVFSQSHEIQPKLLDSINETLAEYKKHYSADSIINVMREIADDTELTSQDSEAKKQYTTYANERLETLTNYTPTLKAHPTPVENIVAKYVSSRMKSAAAATSSQAAIVISDRQAHAAMNLLVAKFSDSREGYIFSYIPPECLSDSNIDSDDELHARLQRLFNKNMLTGEIFDYNSFNEYKLFKCIKFLTDKGLMHKTLAVELVPHDNEYVKKQAQIILDYDKNIKEQSIEKNIEDDEFDNISLGSTATDDSGDVDVINLNMPESKLQIVYRYHPKILKRLYYLPKAEDFTGDNNNEENRKIVRAFNHDIKRITVYNRQLIGDSVKLSIIGCGTYMALMSNPFVQAAWACMALAQGICLAKHSLSYYYYRQNRKEYLYRAMKKNGYQSQANDIAQRIGLKNFSDTKVVVPKILQWFIGNQDTILNQAIPNHHKLYRSLISTILACLLLTCAAILPTIGLTLTMEVSKAILITGLVLLSGYSIHKSRSKKPVLIVPKEDNPLQVPEEINPLLDANEIKSSQTITLNNGPRYESDLWDSPEIKSPEDRSICSWFRSPV